MRNIMRHTLTEFYTLSPVRETAQFLLYKQL
jgi:hypothetical protein